MIMKKSEYQQKETDMALSKDQEELYKRTMEEVRRQLDNLDDEVEKELQKVRRRLAELQESKKSLKMVYEGTAKLLGIEVEAEEEENGDSAAASAKM
jgi:phosphomevalonate kinase